MLLFKYPVFVRNSSQKVKYLTHFLFIERTLTAVTYYDFYFGNTFTSQNNQGTSGPINKPITL